MIIERLENIFGEFLGLHNEMLGIALILIALLVVMLKKKGV